MSIGSGLASSVGLAAESVYGTYAAPTRHVEAQSADLKKVKGIVQGGGLAAGRMVQPASRRVVTTEAGTGSIPMEVVDKGMGLILSHLFGSSTIAQQGATAAWLQTHALADNVGKSMSVQSGVPDLAGTVRPFTGKGGKIVSAEFSCDTGGELMVTPTFDFQKISEVESLAAPSYPSNVRPFHFAQMAVKLGTVGAEASVAGVRSMNITITRPQKVDRNYAGAAGLKAEPLMNDRVGIAGTIVADFLDKAVFADRFRDDTGVALVWEFVSTTAIAGSFFPTFRIKVPVIFFDGDTPVVEGPDVVSGSFPFTGLFDLTNSPISCEYISTDTSI